MKRPLNRWNNAAPRVVISDLQVLGGGEKKKKNRCGVTPAGLREKWHSLPAQRGHFGLRPTDADLLTIRQMNGRLGVRPSGRARTPGRPGQTFPGEGPAGNERRYPEQREGKS